MNLEYTFEEIEEIEDLGILEIDAYDIGMLDTPHTFFANDILVHNSIFLSASPLIKKYYPNGDFNDDNFMSEKILKITDKIQKYINTSYDYFAENFLSIDSEKHLFNMKQEVIAKSGFWAKKKRYALSLINREGVPTDELEVKGLDVVRTSFPEKFRVFMTEILKDILNNKEKEYIDFKIMELKKHIKETSLSDIARSTSLKNISKWIEKDRNPFDDFAVGTPAHVKAAISYNDLLLHFGLETKYAKMANGEKIKWVYLKLNPFNLDGLAFGDLDDAPTEIVDFITQYVDYDKIFKTELETKLNDIYKAMSWGMVPTVSNKNKNKFF